MTDFLSAVRLFLLSKSEVTDLLAATDAFPTDRRVYVLAMPKEEVDLPPHKVVVVLASGGDLRSRKKLVTEAKIDLVCYGETDFEAAALERPVSEALKFLQREVHGGVLLHNATVSAGPFQARDPEILWPCMRRQALIRADNREV